MVAVKCLIRFQSSEMVDFDHLNSLLIVLVEGLTPRASTPFSLTSLMASFL